MTLNKLTLVAFGVSSAEGWAAPDTGNEGATPSASYARHNPGNLRVSEYEAGNDGQFSIFNNDVEGFYALIRQLELIATDKSEPYNGTQTVEDVFSVYTGLAKGSAELTNYCAVIERISGVKPTDLKNTMV